MEPFVVLVVDDEALIRELIRLYFEREGFMVEEAADGAEALSMIQARRYDMVILDLNIPEVDGWEVCRRVRATSDLPILMLSGFSDLEHRITGFNLGADDYMAKPFNGRELVAKAQVILRRTHSRRPENRTRLKHGSLAVDRHNRTVEISGTKVMLTRIECELLYALAVNPGHVLTRDYLLEHVWGYSFPGGTRTIDVHVTKLREKLGGAADRIVTVRGAGYRFEDACATTVAGSPAYGNCVSSNATVVIR